MLRRYEIYNTDYLFLIFKILICISLCFDFLNCVQSAIFLAIYIYFCYNCTKSMELFMIKTLLLVVVFITQLYSTQIVKLLGDKSYPPYSYLEDSVAKGVYVDIIKAAFAKIPEYDVEFRMASWDRSIVLVKKGKAVGFFPPYYSEERTKWTEFSEPILAEKSIVYALPETLKGKNRFPEDFFGLTVCLNKGFTLVTGGVKMKKAIENKDLKLIYAKNNKACLGRVFRGVADLYVNDQLIDISEFPEIKRGLVAAENAGHIGFTLKKEKYPFIDDLKKKFNAVIVEMKKSDEIDKILKNYI